MEAGGGHGGRKQETQEDDWVRTLVTLSARVQCQSHLRGLSGVKNYLTQDLFFLIIFKTVEQVSAKKSLKYFFSLITFK